MAKIAFWVIYDEDGYIKTTRSAPPGRMVNAIFQPDPRWGKVEIEAPGGYTGSDIDEYVEAQWDSRNIQRQEESMGA